MASFQVLLLVLVAVACSLFAVSIGWCTQSNLSSCSFEIQICCNNECVFGSGCLGGFCSMDSDCAVSESCCESRCRSDCFGYLYFTESDRGSKSSGYDSSDTTPIVTYATIAGVVIIACLFFACLYCYVYRQRQVLRRGQRVLTSNVTTARNASEGTPPYPGQEPPSYQHSHPGYPPPQYGQHQSASPPPYSFGAAVASDHPPSYAYSVGIETESGGVNYPKGTYGAVQ